MDLDFPKSFCLIRDDKIVAYASIFSSGKVAVNWIGEYSSVVIWDSLKDLVKVNGHSNTSFIYQQNEIHETSKKDE